jgi:hypothetical protein
VPESAIDRTLALMSASFEYASVEGWEPLVDQPHLPDPDDRHVLAATIASGAGAIVTANLRHFPAASLRPHRITPMSPDQFLQDVLSSDADTVPTALSHQVGRYRRPPMDLGGPMTRLDRAGAPEFTKRVADVSG